MIERSRVRVRAGAAGECSSPGSSFCADSFLFLFSVSLPSLCYHSSTEKGPGHSAKSAGDRLQLNTHAS